MTTVLIFRTLNIISHLSNTESHYKLENVAINDVLPPKAARRDANADLKCFWAWDTRDLISMVTFTFTMWRHLIRLASAPFIFSRLATFGWVRFRSATRGNHNAGFTKGGWNSDPVVSRLWTKVYEIFRRCRKPLVLFNALFQLSVSRFFQKIFAIKSRSRRKTEQMQNFFGPQFFVRDATTFLLQFVRAT